LCAPVARLGWRKGAELPKKWDFVAGHLAVLGPGDWVDAPRGVRHSATVVGDEAVVSLDAVKLV